MAKRDKDRLMATEIDFLRLIQQKSRRDIVRNSIIRDSIIRDRDNWMTCKEGD